MVYDKNFDGFTRKYFLKGNEHLVNPSSYGQDYANVIFELCETLLYHDGVVFYLYGENIIVPVLMNAFGVNGFNKLLEQGAIKFIFNVPQVAYNIDKIKGLTPISAMVGFSSEAHSIPEISAKLGMDFYANTLWRGSKERLIKKVTKEYIVPNKEISSNAVQFGVDGYRRNLFSDFGLPNNSDITTLSLEQRKLLCSLTSEYVDISLLSQNHLYINQSFQTAKLYEDNLKYLYGVATTKESTDNLFRLEQLPDFTAMLKEKIIEAKDIPELRDRPDSIKFRRWIAESMDYSDSESISKAYIDSIYHCKGVLDREPYKFIKTIFMSVLGACTGRLGQISPVVDISLNILDTYLISNVAQGWNPKHFFTKQIEPIAGDKKKR